MNIIKKIFIYIQNIFIKQNKIKALEEPKSTINYEQKNDFIKSIKIDNKKTKIKKRIETLICDGDGLGIQKRISY